MDTTGYLYNQSRGGFGFSALCMEEYRKRSGGMDPDEYDRTDPILLELFKEKGSKWMSANYARIMMKEYHNDIIKYVYHPEDERWEYPRIDTAKIELILFRKFIKDVETGNKTLETEYDEMIKERKRLLELAEKYKDVAYESETEDEF